MRTIKREQGMADLLTATMPSDRHEWINDVTAAKH
jgi:hypothetical protein